MKSKLSLCALAMMVWGCNTSDSSGPPDLTMRDVVGCWKDSFSKCHFKCFDRGGGFYYLYEAGSLGSVEYLGSFELHGYDVNVNYRYYTTWGSTSTGSSQFSYTRIGDTLKNVNLDGNISTSYYLQVPSDSMTCATPWQRFTKPAGWDSLVKPLL